MDTAQSDQEPRVLAGKYRLEAQLRTGAMGAIYRAHHLTLDKTVCIKIMHPELAKDEQFAMRFHREARAASRIDHPNSILVLDHGSDDDGTLFIAMELVTGRDLFEIIDEATTSPGGIETVIPPRRIVDLLSQTLAALAAAHDVGILHRDLKPENIMVASSWDDGERVKVCDFGIARIDEPKDAPAESGRRLTRHGLILGTPEYMSPEQARAESVDARSDVYSAGIILFHLLTGRVPFEDESPIAVALKQINAEPPRPSELNPNVNPQLEAVCLKAISKDPANRYANAREMRAALRDAVSLPHSTPLPLMLTPQTLPEPIEPPKERLSSLPAVQMEDTVPRPRSKRAFAMVAALVIATAVGATWKLGHPPTIATANAASKVEVALLPVAAAPVVAAPIPIVTELAEAKPVVVAEKPVMIAPRKAVIASAPHPSPKPIIEEPPAVVAPTPEPVVVAKPPEPEPVPAQPAPPPVAVPAAAPAPAYSLETAHVDIGAAQTVGATSASVDRALAPAKARLDACYRAALPRAAAPDGTAMLHLETDDVGVIRQANVTGAFSAETGACISKAIIGRKVANVDTGHATADVPLMYRPR